MKIGLFDHVERGDRPLATLFDERLTFVKAADEAGIYCLHVAEHHATPLNMVPVPGVYLGAVARATKRMRLGPLVYLLPLYSPLRLIEEICMLDHLSHGRLEVGVGRGVSPFELKYHKIEHDDSRDIFIDAFNCISAGLTADTLNYSGTHYQYENVPIALRPLQQPHPAVLVRLLQHHRRDLGGRARHAFRQPRARRRSPRPISMRSGRRSRSAAVRRSPRPSFPAAPRSACCATSSWPIPTRRPSASASRPWSCHLAQLNWLRDQHGVTGLTSRLNVPRGATFEDCVADGSVIAGTPQRCARRNRAAGGRARRELPAHLSFPRRHVACRGVALAAAVFDGSDAEARAALIRSRCGAASARLRDARVGNGGTPPLPTQLLCEIPERNRFTVA